METTREENSQTSARGLSDEADDNTRMTPPTENRPNCNDNTETGEGEIEDVPNDLREVSLQCFSHRTLDKLKHYLDVRNEVQSSTTDHFKDFTGVAEWAHLDESFTRYIDKVSHHNKIGEVISMWLKGESDGPKATVGNFIKCMRDLERPDVILDAIQWISM